MNQLIIAVVCGIIAAAAVWIEHTFIQSNTDTIEQKKIVRFASFGAGIGYLATMISSYFNTDNTNVIDDSILDSLKIGRPSF